MIKARESREPEFEIVPAGNHQAVCTAVYDLGLQETEYMGETKRLYQIVITWEINELMTKGKYAGQRFTISKKYTNSTHEKSNMRQDLESWRGKPYGEGEMEKLDLEMLIGKNCLLNIVHKQFKGKTFANIASIGQLAKGMQPMKPELSPEHMPKWIAELQAKQIREDVPEHKEHLEGDFYDNSGFDMDVVDPNVI